MRRSFEIIGIGEGLAPLFACSLLAHRGMSCLWVDTAPPGSTSTLPDDTPLVLTEAFYDGILKPVTGGFGRLAARRWAVEHGIYLLGVASGNRMPPEGTYTPGACSAKSRATVSMPRLARCLARPEWYLRWLACRKLMASRGRGHTRAPGMSGRRPVTPDVGLMPQGALCSVDLGTARNALKEILTASGGRMLRCPGARTLSDGTRALGVETGDFSVKGSWLLDEQALGCGKGSCFHLYGRCRVPMAAPLEHAACISIASCTHGILGPIMAKLRSEGMGCSLHVHARVSAETGLVSLTETVSWAQAAVARTVMDFLGMPGLMRGAFEATDPTGPDGIRPWFRYSGDFRPPIFRVQRFVRPLGNVFAMDRDLYADLGDDGEFFWGICAANAILKCAGRRDLFVASGNG